MPQTRRQAWPLKCAPGHLSTDDPRPVLFDLRRSHAATCSTGKRRAFARDPPQGGQSGRAFRAARVCAAASDRKSQVSGSGPGPAQPRHRAGFAARHGARTEECAGDDRRLLVDDLFALRGVHDQCLPGAEVEIYRYRICALRVSGIPARRQGCGRLDAGAHHRKRRCRAIFRRHRTLCSGSRIN